MEQTNRTILFEEINPERENLLAVLDAAKDQESLTDEEISEIEKLFIVHSFEEVLNKFQPTIYFVMDYNRANYSFAYEKSIHSEKQCIPIHVDLQNQLLTLFTGMLEYKETGKIPSQKLSNLAEYVFPQQDYDKLTKLRRKAKAYYVDKQFEQAEQLLDEELDLLNNPLLHIHFFINEAQTLLQKEKLSENFIRIQESPEMQLKILCCSAKFEKIDPCMESEETKGFHDWLKNYFSQRKICLSEVVSQNLLSDYEASKEDLMHYITIYKQTLQLYGNIVKDYWRHVQPLLQNLLGIRSFFSQYGNCQGAMKPSLLVANCTIQQILESNRLNLLETFLRTVNQKNTHSNTIWYGIVPRVENPNMISQKNIRERFSGNGESEDVLTNDIDTTKVIMNILAKYKIQIFFSTVATEQSTFPMFIKTGMDGFYDAFRPFEKENYTTYLVPCYPNFRLMLKEQAKVSLGMELEIDELNEEVFYAKNMKNVWLTGLYIDAAYVATGLVAAYQCTDYLSGFYPRTIDKELPGVAYRILEGENRKRSKTAMAKEVCSYSDELIKQIGQQGSGIIFGNEREGITILSDKTMALQSGNRISISQVQTMTYLERIIRAMTQDYKDTLIKKFFVNRQDNILHKWRQSRDMVNSLFRDEENIQYQINEQEGTCKFEVQFKNSFIESNVKLSR